MSHQRFKKQYRRPEYPAMPGAKKDDFEEYATKPKPPTPAIEEEPDTIYGIPKIALAIIGFNFALWSCGLLSYWLGRASLPQIITGMSILMIGFVIWLVIAYIQWRFFWWLLALSASLSTLGLGYVYIGLMTGSFVVQDVLNSLGLGRLF